jgi:2-polyprenyl-3-methyl-5-hydroxy-6-metoxy-1,4-benzoquinol methylase
VQTSRTEICTRTGACARIANLNGASSSSGRPATHDEFQLKFGRILLAPVRRFDPNHPDVLDQPGLDRALLREELRTLENCNRRLCGHDLAIHYVNRFVEASGAASLRILDMATGVADIPRAIAAWARQRQLPVEITAVDGNSEVLQVACESCRGWPEIRFERQNLLALPYPAESFDLVLCSLSLHHFESAEAVAVLRSMRRLARGGYVLNDLRRNWLAICSTELLVRALFRSPVFRHDAVQACRAAFTVGELRAMAERAGLVHFQIHRHHAVFRMALEGRK